MRGLPLSVVNLNRFFSSIFFFFPKQKKSEHESYTLSEFFNWLTCLANILPEKEPPNAKEKDCPFSTNWKRLLPLRLRATLDEGPRSRDQWIQAILLIESFKSVPRPLNEGARPKSGKLRLNLHGTCFGGKINWFRPKNSAKRRAPDLENQESR
jgi:hypothetical protein